MRKQWMDYDSNVMMQKTFTLFIENGMFVKHRKEMVEHYIEKSKRAKKTGCAQRKSRKESFMGRNGCLRNADDG